MSQVTYYQRNREAILNSRKKKQISFWRIKVNSEREREREREREYWRNRYKNMSKENK